MIEIFWEISLQTLPIIVCLETLQLWHSCIPHQSRCFIQMTYYMTSTRRNVVGSVYSVTLSIPNLFSVNSQIYILYRCIVLFCGAFFMLLRCSRKYLWSFVSFAFHWKPFQVQSALFILDFKLNLAISSNLAAFSEHMNFNANQGWKTDFYSIKSSRANILHHRIIKLQCFWRTTKVKILYNAN